MVLGAGQSRVCGWGTHLLVLQSHPDPWELGFPDPAGTSPGP